MQHITSYGITNRWYSNCTIIQCLSSMNACESDLKNRNIKRKRKQSASLGSCQSRRKQLPHANTLGECRSINIKLNRDKLKMGD